MLNPKTGTVWTPDIRPDKIETFEEIYTSEGGEQQAITYKIVDNHPILNKVLDKFAFFKTHVSAIWYNKLANITLKQKLDEMDAGIQDVSVKIELSAYVKRDAPTLNPGNNNFSIEKPSVNGYKVICMIGVRVTDSGNVVLKGFRADNNTVSVYSYLSSATGYNIDTSWLLQKTI